MHRGGYFSWLLQDIVRDPSIMKNGLASTSSEPIGTLLDWFRYLWSSWNGLALFDIGRADMIFRRILRKNRDFFYIFPKTFFFQNPLGKASKSKNTRSKWSKIMFLPKLTIFQEKNCFSQISKKVAKFRYFQFLPEYSHVTSYFKQYYVQKYGVTIKCQY